MQKMLALQPCKDPKTPFQAWQDSTRLDRNTPATRYLTHPTRSPEKVRIRLQTILSKNTSHHIAIASAYTTTEITIQPSKEMNMKDATQTQPRSLTQTSSPFAARALRHCDSTPPKRSRRMRHPSKATKEPIRPAARDLKEDQYVQVIRSIQMCNIGCKYSTFNPSRHAIITTIPRLTPTPTASRRKRMRDTNLPLYLQRSPRHHQQRKQHSCRCTKKAVDRAAKGYRSHIRVSATHQWI